MGPEFKVGPFITGGGSQKQGSSGELATLADYCCYFPFGFDAITCYLALFMLHSKYFTLDKK